MPSEPLPWDRRDFRRHDRSGSSDARGFGGGGGGGGGSYRWREQNHAPPPYHHHHQQQQRWYSDFRSSRPIPPGHGKQGGWHMYPDESDNGFTPFGSRYNDRNFEDENFRPRSDGRYFRNNRENRNSFTQKDWKAPPPNPNNNSKNSDTSHHDKNGIAASSVQKFEKEKSPGSTEWKPLKWARSGSSNSRGSGFSNSSSLKSMQPKNASAADCVAVEPSVVPELSDENCSRKKKPRLGWGEGLAKYEKKKDGPNDNGVDVETLPHNKSPGVASFSDCASPATPSSVACSSSPGIEEKESVREANVDHGTPNLSCSPSIMSQPQYTGPAFNLENPELTSIANLSSMISEVVQSDDQSSAETGYIRTTSMNKLLVLKVNMLKALEITESEIDSLETELKSLIPKPVSSCPHPTGSSSLPGEFATRPAPLEIASSGAHMVVENALEDDSPGTATSKFVEQDINVEGFMNLGVDNSRKSDGKCLKNGFRNVLALTDSCKDHASVGSVLHFDVDDIYETIYAPNKYCANRASEELNNLLPAKQSPSDISTVSSVSALQRVSSVVTKRFLARKRFLCFKEKAVALKFKVFQHFWKEGRIVSVRKLRSKAHRKLSAHKKNRSSCRSRISISAGALQTVPADEVIEFIYGLLSESPFKPYRNTLKMPPLILDKETKMSRFISNNGLVEDPCAVEKERSVINPWTSEEKEIFIDKLATFGKDFKKISSFLNHKTIADCIEFYYKNHKSESFRRARKKPDFTKQKKSQSNTYLIASGGKIWNNRESNAANVEIHQKGKSGPVQRSNRLEIYSNERETTLAADVLAGICGSLSSEATMNFCITSSLKQQPLMSARNLEDDDDDEDDECSDECCGEMMAGPKPNADWTDQEKSKFVLALSSHGKDFTKISIFIGTRSPDECQLFFGKARKSLGLDRIRARAGNDVAVNNGGDGNIEGGDACDVVKISGFRENGLENKMEEDLNLPPPKKNSLIGDNLDSKGQNGSKVACESMQELGTKKVEEENNLNGSNEVEFEVKGHFGNKKVEDRDASSCEASEISCAVSDVSVKSSSLFSVPIKYQKNPNHNNNNGMTLKGYPVSVHKTKGINGNSHSDPSKDFSIQKCNGSKVDNKPSGNGDVKLFGKIIIPSSSQQNLPSSCSDDNNKKPGSNNNPKLESDQKLNPGRSFGFWDGNRIQPGLPPLPDSAILLTKYPAAFSNYAPPLLNGTPQDVLFSGINDPVAAIKLHYANKAEQISLQMGEDDKWRSSSSNGDLGRL